MKTFDPSGLHPSDAVQVGEGQGDEYEESKKSSKAKDDKPANAKEVAAGVPDLSEEELAELKASDDRKGVQDAIAAEEAKRAEAAEASDEPPAAS